MKITATSLATLAVVTTVDAFSYKCLDECKPDQGSRQLESSVDEEGVKVEAESKKTDGGLRRKLDYDVWSSGKGGPAPKAPKAPKSAKGGYGKGSTVYVGKGSTDVWGKGGSVVVGKGSTDTGKGKGGYVVGKGSTDVWGKGGSVVEVGKGKGGYASYKAPKSKGFKAPKSAKGVGKGGYVEIGKGKGGTVDVGKGKGGTVVVGKGSYDVGTGKGSLPTTGACHTIPILFYKSELESGFISTKDGGGFDNVNFYNAATGEQLGFYSDFASNLGTGDCVGTGAFSFNGEPNYDDQVAVAYTCFGTYNSVTGGTGQYGCAGGYEMFVSDDDTAVRSELHVCGTLCPPPVPTPYN